MTRRTLQRRLARCRKIVDALRLPALRCIRTGWTGKEPEVVRFQEALAAEEMVWRELHPAYPGAAAKFTRS